ncbi:MAG: hypothetical protein IJT26_01500 [Bacteroidales bacterium]|nr:hypothetical protein [Bacteroidales bacterium]
MKKSIFVFLIILTISGCQKRYPNILCDGHFLIYMLRVDSLSVSNSGTSIILSHHLRECSDKEKQEAWSFYKDTGYFGHPMMEDIGDKVLNPVYYIDCRFASINIWALTKFDSSHDEGALLNDCFSMKATMTSVPEWIQSGYKKGTGSWYNYYYIDDLVCNIDFNQCLISETTDYSFYLVLECQNKPDQSSIIRIDLIDNFGQTFTATTTVYP